MPVKVVNVREWKGNGTYIGRAKDQKYAVFGNPYSHLDNTLASYKVATVEEAIACYREYSKKQWAENEAFRLALSSLVRSYLRGKDVVLACFCVSEQNPNAPCHGFVLKELIESLAELKVVTLQGEEDAPF